MVGAPRVLVLDEPTRGMDTSHKASLARMARDLADKGKGVMVITHDLEFAARVGDRFAVLEEGRVVMEGPACTVFEERPLYAPLLWRASEGLDLGPEDRPLSPLDLVSPTTELGGGGAW